MKYLSVCSGIEAATVAWHSLGWQAFAYSEIEKFPSAVLAYHYPHTPNLGDMTKYQEWPDAAIDVLVGGTPCQSFSVAGLRKGLDDPRGNLMLTYGAIAGRYRPRWLVWENVPGVLSSNGGRDFGAFLGMLAELGYGFAYRILDAQYTGVAQRRRRVFVVGYLGDWRRAAAVLFERHSLCGNPAPRRKAGEGITPTIRAGAANGGAGHGARSGDSKDELIVPVWPAEVAGTLDAHYGDKMGLENQHVFNQHASRFVPATAHTLRAEGFDASADGTGRGIPLVPVAFDTTQITSAANYSNPKPGDPCHPLASGAHPPAIAFGWQNSSSQGDSANEQVTPTLDKSKTPAVALALRGRDGGATAELGDDCAFTVRASSGGGDKPHAMVGMAVRRLTPVECERLQGFPDGYTDIRPRGKDTPDGPRYKALGNSMAVPCMRWIGGRIAAVDAITATAEAA